LLRAASFGVAVLLWGCGVVEGVPAPAASGTGTSSLSPTNADEHATPGDTTITEIFTGEVECVGEVGIPDPGLRQALLDAQLPGEPSLQATVLAALLELQARERGIENLDGIQCASNLRVIQLHDNLIEDGTPLAKLEHVEALYLDGNPLEDVPDLSRSPLENLSLVRTRVESLEPLRAIETLKVLNLEGAPVVDLEPLAGLSQLWSLVLTGTRVGTLEPLRDSPAMTRLHARCLGLDRSALEVVASFPVVADVDLAYNRLSATDDLAGAGEVGTLVLGNPQSGTSCADRNLFQTIAPLAQLDGVGRYAILWLQHAGLGVDDCPDIDALRQKGAVVLLDDSLVCP
jgi:hypothetical protein